MEIATLFSVIEICLNLENNNKWINWYILMYFIETTPDDKALPIEL